MLYYCGISCHDSFICKVKLIFCFDVDGLGFYLFVMYYFTLYVKASAAAGKHRSLYENFDCFLYFLESWSGSHDHICW